MSRIQNGRRYSLDDFSREAGGTTDDPPTKRIDDWFYAIVLVAAGIIGLALYGLYVGIMTWS